MSKTTSELNEISGSILESSFKIHTQYGPGLLENAYEALLEHELKKKGHYIQRQAYIPLPHEELEVKKAYRLDLLVDDEVIVELKSKKELTEIDHKKLLTYLRLTNKRLGLLINFHEVSLKNGIFRKVNNF